MQYPILNSQCADKVWQYFSLGTGLTHGVSLQQVYRFPKIKRLSSNWPELVNGASRGNPGKSGLAVVFRDAAGDFFVLLPVQTNMYSEIMAIQLATEICVHKGFTNVVIETNSTTNVVIETDSTIARLIMIQEVSAPWAVDTIVRKIITLLRDK
ncbi:hypothetical protein T459_22328 [Capsicum annuum]|uniref:RNase H type-1 domain-containing protein n=1 Tax=Capsicum annuum TaxID=4072 RepID=A0A2G2YZI0_CAPAN|nr:hypothetical protein T459_22328 [Capsicum annuum]